MSSESDDFHVEEARELVSIMNRKKKKSGGFQAMGLSHSVFKGVMKKGYKLPTPIQRKTIPLILTGRDVVAMARTGSGKTAAFLIPLFEKLKQHINGGPRALILSPTRELALQTLKFAKELGKFTGLTAAVILGGDRMEEQFAALHSSPDIIVATPGRLLHVVMEMNLKLKTIEYVVFDEGDRLFELGFAAQLTETLSRLPCHRQTLIFSATLPSSLIDFAKAGLNEPVLIRLDVDHKLNKNLKLVNLSCLKDEKTGILLYLIKQLIPLDQQTVIFFATKHHVEFFQMLFTEMNIPCTSIHSGLDIAARTSAMKEFCANRIRLLLVTDVAARGVDMPLLDNMINYHFPCQPKLFLHRVGRVARAGRSGTAYSLVEPEEVPFLFDVFVLLGKNLTTACDGESTSQTDDLLARPPHRLGSVHGNCAEQLITQNVNLASMSKVCDNAMKRFAKTKPKASAESVRRAKELRLLLPSLRVHPAFPDEEDAGTIKILEVIRNRKLPTIFEAMGRNANPTAYDAMVKKRRLHNTIIERRHAQQSVNSPMQLPQKPRLDVRTVGTLINSSSIDDGEDLEHTDFFIPRSRGDAAAEEYLAVFKPTGQFSDQAQVAAFSLPSDDLCNGDEQHPVGARQRKLVWDRRQKRYRDSEAVAGCSNLKRIRTESGVWIPASYKTDKYKQWLKRSGQGHQVSTEGEDSVFTSRFGAVVNFTEDEVPIRKPKDRKTSRQPTEGGDASKGLSSFGKANLSVVGTKTWKERAAENRRQQAENVSQTNIRMPKGSRTFGQLRKPEQIMKRRREIEKEKQKAQRVRSGGKRTMRGGKQAKRGGTKLGRRL